MEIDFLETTIAGPITTAESLEATLKSKVATSIERERELSAKVESLQKVADIRKEEWDARLSQLNRMSRNEVKERELLIERVRQAEDRSASATRQFNELYDYCESLYQDAESRRKEAETKLAEAQALISRFEPIAAELQTVQARNEELVESNDDLSRRLQQLIEEREHDQAEHGITLSSLTRGSECIRSGIRAMNDFQGSFQTYLSSIEKNGFTPITQRTGKLFAETWKIQRENIEKIAKSLEELVDMSSETHPTNC